MFVCVLNYRTLQLIVSGTFLFGKNECTYTQTKCYGDHDDPICNRKSSRMHSHESQQHSVGRDGSILYKGDREIYFVDASFIRGKWMNEAPSLEILVEHWRRIGSIVDVHVDRGHFVLVRRSMATAMVLATTTCPAAPATHSTRRRRIVGVRVGHAIGGGRYFVLECRRTRERDGYDNLDDDETYEQNENGVEYDQREG